MERTVHRRYAGISLGNESFTDLDFVDDVTVLAEILEILILSLEIIHDEACPLGLKINWDKTKIQGYSPSSMNPTSVPVLGYTIKVVESFNYLCCQIDSTGGSEGEIHRRI